MVGAAVGVGGVQALLLVHVQRARGEAVVGIDVLVAGVQPDIAKAVRWSGHGYRIAGEVGAGQAAAHAQHEATDGEVALGQVPGVGRARVWRDPTQTTVVVRIDAAQECRRQRAIAAGLEVPGTVQLHVGTGANHLTTQATEQHRLGRSAGRQIRRHVRVHPRRRGVEHVADGGVVVDGDAPDAGVAAAAEHARVTQIHVVPAKQPAVFGIGGLGEDPDVLAQPPGQEHRGLLQLGVVVGAEALGGNIGLGFLRMRERLHQHRRQRQLLRVADLHGVAHQLELSPERGELRAEGTDVARHAGELGLPCIRGDCQRQRGHDRQPRQHRQQHPAPRQAHGDEPASSVALAMTVHAHPLHRREECRQPELMDALRVDFDQAIR